MPKAGKNATISMPLNSTIERCRSSSATMPPRCSAAAISAPSTAIAISITLANTLNMVAPSPDR
ncbi:hypothetical protein [Burkholderia gladioli]|uniref:hypothetical protein n=1 Tax=Burkholderia gladioli TaxID=28095 RepID=UPI001D12C5A0|nr:hypothetical protein [Burkholderia gladioli]